MLKIYKKQNKRKEQIKKGKTKKEKWALLKKKVSQKMSTDLIQTHDDEFWVPCI